MKTEKQLNPQLAKLCELIEEIPAAMLTSRENDGSLVSRPMSPLLMDANGTIWFYADRRSTKIAQMAALNLAFSDPPHATYVSISGHAALDNDRILIDRMWTSWAKPWFPDGPGSLHLALLKFTPETAEYWDAANSRMVRMFAMATSVVAGEPIWMGDHARLKHLTTPMKNVA
ncbi:MAG: pyridoxamine 5'-phosphate oxidase family protein [Betaproteobacteria bacterium]